MLRNILIPLDTSKYTPAAISLASDIAGQVRDALGRDAVTLSGLGIVDLDQIPTGRFANIVPKEQILGEARETVENLLAEFKAGAKKGGVPDEHVEVHHTEGSPFQKIIHHHVFCDLMVMGETCAFAPITNDYNPLDNLFHKASRPLMITPDSPQQVETVVLAMNGTASASRMMYTYAQLNPFPKAKVLLTHSREEEDTHNLKDFFQRVMGYLESYRFNVEQARVEGQLMEALPLLCASHKAAAIAIGIQQEDFIDKLRNSLSLIRTPVEKLLQDTQAVLFTVH